MGHHKSKHLSPQQVEQYKLDKNKRRKWRKKQGYSLPTGMDLVGLSAASSHTDLPDIESDDAILVSYSQSSAEKFAHLRPQFQRRASSEEPPSPHVHVIHISDTKEVRQSPPNSQNAKSIVNISPESETDEDILKDVIENSFKDLEPEDFDILKSIVPEPSFQVVQPPPSPYANEIIGNEIEVLPKDMKDESLNYSEQDDKLDKQNESEFKNKEENIEDENLVQEDKEGSLKIEELQNEQKQILQNSSIENSSNSSEEEKSSIEKLSFTEEDLDSGFTQDFMESLEKPAEEIPAIVEVTAKKPKKKLKDLESANIIDEDFFPTSSFRPSIDCDVLNSVIVEENEDIQSVSSVPNLDNDQEKVEKTFSVSSRCIVKETDVDQDLYHSKLVTTCVDSDEEDFDLKVPNESWTDYKSSHNRPQPVGCSSDSPSNSDKDHYDSLEDEPKLPPPPPQKKRSLPQIPVDHGLQQMRAYEILRQKYDQSKRQLPQPPPNSNFHDESRDEQKSNFLWVGLQQEQQVTKRPKNHERLSVLKKRHSAPPGTLDHVKLGHQQSKKKSVQPKNHSKSGRIHSAVVSGINIDTRSVTVEWFERGETKGKEVELETLLSLNQDLAPVNDNGNNKKYVPRPTITPSNRGSTTTAAVTGAGGPRGGGQGGRATNKVRQTMNGIDIQHQNFEEKQQNGSENVPPARGETKQSTIPPEKMETVSKGTGANRRRSNVVKEIDRLKKNREERRAKQAEILEEKTAKQSVDPGNPNWEFLSMIRDYQEQLEFNPLQDGDEITEHQITVCVRKRPLGKKEKTRKECDVITCPNKDQVIVHEPKTKVDLTKYLDNQHFRFDYVFDDSADNQLVYKYTARPLVQNIFEGGMATCFAYGQTGSGKTHTMGGEFHGKTQDSKNGIYALATKDVFKYLTSPKYKGLKLQVSCSYFEIYSGKVFDLLSGKSKLRVLEDGKQQVQVVGLTESVVTSVEDVLKLITSGNNLRTSGQTSANQHSSRSHAVFQIILRNNTAKKPLYGKFSLIDLAGNERGADTSSANRQTRMEGAEINKSLLALKECIRALGRKGGHLPFRASKLTQVLRDSFIGEKSKTCMIAMVSPGLASCEHTLNTLRYADRVKELGAADPARADGQAKSSPTEGPEGMRMDDGVMSPEDSDLAQLRSLNEGELSADWYNFQEAISHLQALEDELVEAHRATIQNMLKWTKGDASLLAMTNEVDYDQDAYCQQLEDMISEKIEAFHDLREKARNFRSCLRDEEAKSRLLMHRN